MTELVLKVLIPRCNLMTRVLNLKSREYLLQFSSRRFSAARCLITYKNTDQPRICSHLQLLKPVSGCGVEPLSTVLQSRMLSLRSYSSSCDKKDKDETPDPDPDQEKKLSLFQKFKIMYKKYWYVLVPVHIVTSAGWFGAFYYLAKSGVDVVALLESWNFSEVIIKPLRDSSAGYVAIAYALYKIATPVRYTVTLGGTTISINYLTKWGLIKPIPPKERLKEIYEEKKENLKERRDVITAVTTRTTG